MRLSHALVFLSLGAFVDAHCISSQPCWPSPSIWAAFNSSINGHLIAPHPPAWPCHDPHYDAALCAEAQSYWTNSSWRSAQAGAMQSLVWESAECGIDTPRNVSCDQGMVPTYAVAAESEGDVSAAVKFAKKHKIKLVVKNTGHDYLGRSSGAGSLSIWTHNYTRRHTRGRNSVVRSSRWVGARRRAWSTFWHVRPRR